MMWVGVVGMVSGRGEGSWGVGSGWKCRGCCGDFIKLWRWWWEWKVGGEGADADGQANPP